MRFRWWILAIAFFLSNCAVYKELKPKTPLSPKEQGYIELNRKKEKKFEIDKGDKYFIAFPAPAEKNYYLVLKIGNKKELVSFLTDSLHKESDYGQKIKDESEKPDVQSVYPITSGSAGYFWLLDNVPEDRELIVDYRYVPQWRFKFENKYASYKKSLKENLVERKTYGEIGKSVQVEKLNTGTGIDKVAGHISNLEKVYQEILAIEKIFPSSILNSSDTAYKHYVALKKDMEGELEFQKKYLSSLKYFKQALEVRGNPAAFLDNVGNFNSYFSRKPPQDKNVLSASQAVLNKRLDEVIPYYKQRLQGKEDAAPFDQKLYRISEFKEVMALYDTSGVTKSSDVKQLSGFINDFEKNAVDLANGKKGLAAIEKAVADFKELPKEKYFEGHATALGKLQEKAPQKLGPDHGDYGKYASAIALNKEVASLTENLAKGKKDYKEAEGLVRIAVPLIEQKSYSEILGGLKDKKHLPFLLKMYKPLDNMSVKHQAEEIGQALAKFSWGKAESGLFTLHKDENFIDIVEVGPLKKEIVSEMEDSLYIKVDVLTRHKVNKFVEERWNELKYVDSLYSDSVFLPAHDIKFTTGGKQRLLTRKENLVAHLAKLKENEFPAKAIKLLYKEFLKRPSDKGVLKARAVVAHGKHYKGEDKEIKRRIYECDPWGPKWITKPTKYRRVFALPITTKRGENTYLCRINIRVKTEAKFPVYDINIKIPKEVSRDAGNTKWYDKITLDKKPLKSEGRFTITAPTAKNGHEAQISPVRVKKDKSNFLDIYFKHKSLKVMPISVMVQKPLIKKN